jgi:hypothetical protein
LEEKKEVVREEQEKGLPFSSALEFSKPFYKISTVIVPFYKFMRGQ